jgi:hypothetical protein
VPHTFEGDLAGKWARSTNVAQFLTGGCPPPDALEALAYDDFADGSGTTKESGAIRLLDEAL